MSISTKSTNRSLSLLQSERATEQKDSIAHMKIRKKHMFRQFHSSCKKYILFMQLHRLMDFESQPPTKGGHRSLRVLLFKASMIIFNGWLTKSAPYSLLPLTGTHGSDCPTNLPYLEPCLSVIWTIGSNGHVASSVRCKDQSTVGTERNQEPWGALPALILSGSCTSTLDPLPKRMILSSTSI